jgi:inward rectifier potassium channel
MQKGQHFHTGFKRNPRERAARVRLGSLEFKKKGVSRFDMRDPYHLAVALTWPQFLATLLATYLLVNVAFATFFWLVPGSVANARPYSFPDAFFFSIETLATVGYGEMYPATPYGHVIAAIEIVCGLSFTAILTGLTFVRFSRPRAKFVFASHPVVAMHNGKPTMMLRVGNGRAHVLMDAEAKLNVLLAVATAEGKLFRRAQELRLERAHLPVFPLTWTLMHVMDERSPLHGYDAAQVVAALAQVFVTLEARDPMLATSVHEIRNYPPEDIRFGMRYVDAITTEEDGMAVADLTKIGEMEPDVGEHPEQGWNEREDAPG